MISRNLVYFLLLLGGTVKFSMQNCQTNPLEYKVHEQMSYSYKWHEYKVPISYSVTCQEYSNYLISTENSESEIKRIVISKSNHTTILTGIFQDYINLMSLKIDISNINDIQPGAFNGLMRLENLELTNNLITKLSKGMFNSLTTLKGLKLSNNRINIIEENAFLGMKNLQNISLSKNSINNIMELYNININLEILDLSYNKISNLISFKNFSKLHTLILNNNLIIQLSHELDANAVIRNLNLSSNLIQDIDSNALVGLANLDNLNLASNRLSNLQDGKLPIGLFRDNKLLKTLNISRTGLDLIPVGSFTGLTYLFSLDLSFNNISYLPKGIFHDQENLNELYINDNSFSQFDFDGFGKLHKINLNDNPWNCDTLSNITKQLKGTQIVRGELYNTTNVFGIGCIDDQYQKEVCIMNVIAANTITEKCQADSLRENHEITLNATIDEYRNIYEEIRNDLQLVYQEFSEKFFEILRTICLTSTDDSKSVLHDEENDVALKLIQSTLDKINLKESEVKERIQRFENPQKLKSDNQSSHIYYDSNTSMILLCILVVLILGLLCLISIFYILLKIKMLNDFSKTQIPLLENARL